MNKDNAKDYLPLVQALAEGKTIEFQDCQGFWCGNPQVNFDAPASRYRIKPSPSYRPWTFDEVPMGAVLRSKDGRTIQTIAGKHLAHGHAAYLSLDGWVNLGLLHSNYVLLDGKPCGVAV